MRTERECNKEIKFPFTKPKKVEQIRTNNFGILQFRENREKMIFRAAQNFKCQNKKK